jgi:hypothetical protein
MQRLNVDAIQNQRIPLRESARKYASCQDHVAAQWELEDIT